MEAAHRTAIGRRHSTTAHAIRDGAREKPFGQIAGFDERGGCCGRPNQLGYISLMRVVQTPPSSSGQSHDFVCDCFV
jgi:hypothetical protein